MKKSPVLRHAQWHLWHLVHASPELQQKLKDIHERFDAIMDRAFTSDAPESFAQELYALQLERQGVLDEVYRSPQAANAGRLVERISLELAGEFLKLACIRLNAREILGYGLVELIPKDFEMFGNLDRDSIEVRNIQGQLVIKFTGRGSIEENEFDAWGNPTVCRILDDPTTSMDTGCWNKDGVYDCAVQRIIEFRHVQNVLQSRTFTGFGTLNMDWKTVLDYEEE